MKFKNLELKEEVKDLVIIVKIKFDVLGLMYPPMNDDQFPILNI